MFFDLTRRIDEWIRVGAVLAIVSKVTLKWIAHFSLVLMMFTLKKLETLVNMMNLYQE